MSNPTITAFRTEFAKVKKNCEGAFSQLTDAQLHVRLADDHNSVRVICKHMAGNLRSRFTDFLTTDGEKPWRNRDTEFVEDAPGQQLSMPTLRAEWDSAWAVLFELLASLNDADMGRIVTIRTEPHTVALALARQLAHYGYHTGQIVLISKTLRGSGWKYLSVPRGASAAFNAEMGRPK